MRTDRYKLIRRFDAYDGPVLPNIDDGPTKDALVALGWDGWATEEERLHDVLLDPGEMPQPHPTSPPTPASRVTCAGG